MATKLITIIGNPYQKRSLSIIRVGQYVSDRFQTFKYLDYIYIFPLAV